MGAKERNKNYVLEKAKEVFLERGIIASIPELVILDNTKSTTLYLPAIGKDAKGLRLVSSIIFCSFSSKFIIPIQLFVFSLYPLYYTSISSTTVPLLTSSLDAITDIFSPLPILQSFQIGRAHV